MGYSQAWPRVERVYWEKSSGFKSGAVTIRPRCLHKGGVLQSRGPTKQESYKAGVLPSRGPTKQRSYKADLCRFEVLKSFVLPAFELLESAKRVRQYFSLCCPFGVSLSTVSASFAWPSTDQGLKHSFFAATLWTASGISQFNEKF